LFSGFGLILGWVGSWVKMFTMAWVELGLVGH